MLGKEGQRFNFHFIVGIFKQYFEKNIGFEKKTS